MNLREVETLVDLVHVARVSEVTIRANGRCITIRKDPNAPRAKQSPIEIVRHDESIRPQAPAAVAEAPPASEAIVAAPMVGVFHAAPKPVGIESVVVSGQVVGAIESMRLMNDVRAEASGKVVAILVEDGMAVEYGQPIFRLNTKPHEDSGQDGV